MFQRGILKSVVVVSFSMLAFVLMAGQGYTKDKTLEEKVAALEAKVAALEAKLQYMSVVTGTINGLKGPHVIFENANVHVRSGSFRTDDYGEPLGLGNLIVGYNETVYSPGWGQSVKTGSHNLVIGAGHTYSSSGGFVAGQINKVTSLGATVSGGYGNTASGHYSSISGGQNNTASGHFSSVSGGNNNTPTAHVSSVSGGSHNTASGDFSSVSGGEGNTASNTYSSVSGGQLSTASGLSSSVSGGLQNTASGDFGYAP